jgi:hypothetical protein
MRGLLSDRGIREIARAAESRRRLNRRMYRILRIRLSVSLFFIVATLILYRPVTEEVCPLMIFWVPNTPVL